jgi:2-dehydropantoate 2-reductase
MPDQDQSIAILGGGAMGGMFGAQLAEAGHRVLVVDVSSETVEAINRDGVVVETAQGTRVARLAATPNPVGSPLADVIFVFVKAQHTASAMQLARPLIGVETIVVSLQNGWGNADLIAESVDPRQLVVGVTYHSATLARPGRVRHTAVGQTFVGPFRDRDDLANAQVIAAIMAGAAIETTATGSVKTEIWKKLVLNAATLPTAALTTLRAGELGEPGPILDLVDALATEAVAVAVAQGFDIDRDERLERIHETLARAGAGKPSMLQDAEARRKTEIERINGAVVQAGDATGVAVPLNRTMVTLIGGLERAWTRVGS